MAHWHILGVELQYYFTGGALPWALLFVGQMMILSFVCIRSLPKK